MKKRVTAAILAVIVVLAAGVCAVWFRKSSQETEKSQTALEELREAFVSGADEEELIRKNAVVEAHINEYGEEILVSEITDQENPVKYRIALLQLLEERTVPVTEETQERLLEMLLDEDEENEMKAGILIQADFEGVSDMELLQLLADGKNDMVAYQAIKRLYREDETLAVPIVRRILQDYQQEQPEKINIMLQILSKEYRRMRIQGVAAEERRAAEAEFIEACLDIINNSESDKLKDSAVFALSDMTEPEAVRAIISSSNIDRELKVYAVDQNYLTLKSMLEAREDLETVCQAIEIYPLAELEEELLVILRGGDLDEHLTEQLQQAVNHIRGGGISADPKWITLYDEEL